MGEGRTDPQNADRRDRQRLTVPEAATVLGVTVDAVRGRIRRGKLDSEHDKHGGVYVLLDTEEGDRRGPSEASRGPSPTAEGPAADSRLVEALEARISSLERRLEDETAARERAEEARNEAGREYRRLLLKALEDRPAIEAAPGPPQAPESVPDAPSEPSPRSDTMAAQEDPQKPEATARLPWWRRILGG